MAEKNIKSRIIHKHDIEANWLLATNFTPKQGEIIVYDIDDNYNYERIKIGDGTTNVNELPFANDGFISYNEQTLTDEQRAQARRNIEAKPEDIVAKITSTNVSGVITWSCDKTFAELWAANEEGRDVIFDISGTYNIKGTFNYVYTSSGLVKQIRVTNTYSGSESTYIIVEDDTMTQVTAQYILKSSIKQETGAGSYVVMSQKATTDAINAVSALVGDTAVSEQISSAIDEATADDFGIYVQDTEPTEAVDGDIWVDTANDPSYIPPTIPEITAADNGKVLMVVNGKLQLVNLNLSVDANGVLSV